MIDTFTASEGLTLADLKGLIDPWVEGGWGEMVIVIKDAAGSYCVNTVTINDEEIVLS